MKPYVGQAAMTCVYNDSAQFSAGHTARVLPSDARSVAEGPSCLCSTSGGQLDSCR